MLHTTALLLASCFAQSIMALPTPSETETAVSTIERRAAEGEPYPCNEGAAGTCQYAKSQILSFNGGVTALAIGMQEVGCAYAANYALGGVFPDGSPKTGDNAELGIYRNNWGMLRQYCSHFQGQTAGQWQSGGQQIQYNIGLATDCLNQMIGTLGEYTFYGLQRGGASNLGAGAAYQAQINKYKLFFQQNNGANMYNDLAVYYNTYAMKE